MTCVAVPNCVAAGQPDLALLEKCVEEAVNKYDEQKAVLWVNLRKLYHTHSPHYHTHTPHITTHTLPTLPHTLPTLPHTLPTIPHTLPTLPHIQAKNIGPRRPQK